MGKLYTFREITDINELEEFLKLRYKIYAASINKAVLEENEYQIDIDCYDIHSKHYCLISDEKAAYFRMVLPSESLTNGNILQLKAKFDLQSKNNSPKPVCKAPYPFLSYKEVLQSHKDFFEELLYQNKAIVESSRLIVMPDHRALKATRFLTEAAIALYTFFYREYQTGIVNCPVEYVDFYKEYGFIPIDDGKSYNFNGIQKTSLSFSIDASSIPPKYINQFEAMANEYLLTGKIEREL